MENSAEGRFSCDEDFGTDPSLLGPLEVAPQSGSAERIKVFGFRREAEVFELIPAACAEFPCVAMLCHIHRNARLSQIVPIY